MAKDKRNHEDTWGTNERAKDEWEREHGDAARKETEKANKERERGA